MTTPQDINLAQIVKKLHKVEQECGKLAQQNRILKHLLMIVAVLILGVFVMGQALPNNEIIEAKGFILHDPSGNARAKLTIKDDQPILTLMDNNKQDRIIMTINDGEPSIVLCNKVGMNRAALFLINGSSRLVLLNNDNKPVFVAPHE
ncbi:MAG: hypothetical protein ACLPT6_11190 [Desulfobaccales bacterium]